MALERRFSIPDPLSCSLVCSYASIRKIQRERRNLNIETLTALTLHLVSPAHHPRRRVKRRAASIFKALSRLQHRLLPDDTWSLDLGQFATRICDHPVPAQQLHRLRSLILDSHSISPKILRAGRRRSRLKVSWLNADCYSSCVCRIRCPGCHSEILEQMPSAPPRMCARIRETALGMEAVFREKSPARLP
jgi:hypothetical protein